MTLENGTAATVLEGIAAILRSVLWPIVILTLALVYRIRISRLLDVLTQKVHDAKHLKAGQIELDTQEAISKVVEQTGRDAGSQEIRREVPENQINAARLVERNLRAAPIAFSEKLDVVERNVRALVNQYEQIRRDVSSGPQRTRQMNEITAKIRAYALVAYPLLPFLSESERPCERLAAICILQVKPEPTYFQWLIDRIMEESQAFLLFHASLAILQLIRAFPYVGRDVATERIQSALNHVKGFSGGKPDQNTIDVLTQVLRELAEPKP